MTVSGRGPMARLDRARPARRDLPSPVAARLASLGKRDSGILKIAREVGAGSGYVRRILAEAEMNIATLQNFYAKT